MSWYDTKQFDGETPRVERLVSDPFSKRGLTADAKFELQSRHYIHFRTNTFQKGKNLLILPESLVK